MRKMSILTCIIILLLIESVVGSEPTTNATRETTIAPEQKFTYDHIVNKHDFNYIHNPGFQVCGRDKLSNKQNVFLIVYVHSAPDNFKRRMSMRETWQRRSMFRNVRFVFMMGYAKQAQGKLKLEAEIYKDIVQEDFIDAYRNITYKGIMAMKWISQYCSHARYILKVDDDIIANFFKLLRHLKSLTKHKMLAEKKMCCLGNYFNLLKLIA
jgi:hypothetical protein